jgi:uncharacterized membrane protein
MNTAAVTRTLALGALTGMRSMAGPATLAIRSGGMLKGVMAVAAAAEMIADKTAAVGDRTDRVPLGGRALMGAVVGGLIAREEDASVLLGGLLGAAAAVAAAHVAYRVRARLAGSNPLGGVIEDALVIGAGALYSSPAQPQRPRARTPLRSSR